MRRLSTIEDVGPATAVLTTRAGEFLAGQTVYVDGRYPIEG